MLYGSTDGPCRTEDYSAKLRPSPEQRYESPECAAADTALFEDHGRRLDYVVSRLEEAENLSGSLRNRLFGPFPSEAQDVAKGAHPPVESIERSLRLIDNMLADRVDRILNHLRVITDRI